MANKPTSVARTLEAVHNANNARVAEKVRALKKSTTAQKLAAPGRYQKAYLDDMSRVLKGKHPPPLSPKKYAATRRYQKAAYNEVAKASRMAAVRSYQRLYRKSPPGRLSTQKIQARVSVKALANNRVPKAASKVPSLASKVAKGAFRVVGRVVLPVFAAYGAYQGSKRDSNVARGAARGAVEGLDPTELLFDRGVGERVFDFAFGRATPPKPAVKVGTSQGHTAAPGSGERNGYLNANAKAKALTHPLPTATAAPRATLQAAPDANGRSSYQTKDGRTVQATKGQITRYQARRKN